MPRLFSAALGWCLTLVSLTATRGEHPPADGTLLFLENCSSVVEWSTRGQIAHVALVFHDAGTAYVYEATPAKVRRVTFDEYQLELARLNKRRDEGERILFIALLPKTGYSADETTRMRAFLDKQLGRRYSVKNYVRGKPYDGIHCAELASKTLNESGRYAFTSCHELNPQTFYQAVLPAHREPQTIAPLLLTETEPLTVRARRSTAGWFTWCGWSCREAWLFLW